MNMLPEEIRLKCLKEAIRLVDHTWTATEIVKMAETFEDFLLGIRENTPSP